MLIIIIIHQDRCSLRHHPTCCYEGKEGCLDGHLVFFLPAGACSWSYWRSPRPCSGFCYGNGSHFLHLKLQCCHHLVSLSDLPGKDFGLLLFFDIAAKEFLGSGSVGLRLLVLSLLELDLLSIFWWGHFNIFQYFFTYFFQAFHNNFWVLDPILEANYKQYVRVIKVKDLLASSHLHHADSFCFYYCSA